MRYIGKKVLGLIPVLFAVTLLSYLLLDLLPGDTAEAILGPQATPAGVAALREELGLNDPLPVRYFRWVGGLVTGDLGASALNGQPVLEALGQRLPKTVELLLVSQIIALGIAVPTAILAARRPGGFLDRISSSVAFGFLAVPNFILGVLLVFVFAVTFDIFPAIGLPEFGDDPGGHIRSLILPSVTIAVAELAVYLRLLRTDLIATLQEDFITMARAKGMPTRRILLRHALRPSSFSLITSIGLNFGRLIGGTLIVELIFGLPGMGLLVVQAIYSRDFLVVQGFVVVVALAYVLVNFLIDILYAVLDPRIRHARAIA